MATSTLRTWERRYGLRPSGRTAGGHRRYTAADLAALQRLRQLVDTGMPTASAAALATSDGHHPAPQATAALAGTEKLAQQFTSAVHRLDATGAAAAAARIIERMGVIAAWTDVFTPHLQAAGEHWERTGEGVEREHVGAAAVRAALARHTMRRADGPLRPALLAVATPGEAHALPLDALAAALAEHRIGSVVLEMLPPVAVHAAVEDIRPAVLVLWARSRETSDEGLLQSLVTRVPFVAAAGPGWGSRRLPRAVVHLSDLPAAVNAVRAWSS